MTESVMTGQKRAQGTAEVGGSYGSAKKPMATGKKAYPHRAHGTLIAPLLEGAISTYLETLNVALSKEFVPSPMMVQSLILYVLEPPGNSVPERCPSPLSILDKILALHTPDDLMAHHTLPTCPTSGSGSASEKPRWLEWEAEAEHRSPKIVAEYMKKARDEGIWALLWEEQSAPADAMDVDSDEEEDEDEMAAKQRKRVSNRGWDLLGWLVDFWDKDAHIHLSDLGYSPAFVAQLPKSGDMLRDNATASLAVIWSSLRPVPDSDSHEPKDKREMRRRRDIAGRVLHLLIKTGTVAKQPAFHPPSLTLAMLSLLRTPPSHGLFDILQLFTKFIRPGSHAHFLVHAIEDFAGVRTAKGASRRRKSVSSTSDFQVKHARHTQFPPPTAAYTLDCLLLPVADGRDGDQFHLEILRINLVTLMLKLFNNDKDEAWQTALDPDWRAKLAANSIEAPVVGGEDDFYTGMIRIFDQCIKPA